MEVPVRSCAHYKYKMQQIKLNVIKRSKMPFSKVLVLWDLKTILNGRQNRSKINWQWKRRDTGICKVARSELWAPRSTRRGFSILSQQPGSLVGNWKRVRAGAKKEGFPLLSPSAYIFASRYSLFFLHQVAWSQARFSCARSATSLSATRCMSHYIRSGPSLLQEVSPFKIGSNLISPPKA